MSRRASTIIRVIATILASFVGGVYLARYLAYGAFYEMPTWMYDAMRFLLDHTGNADVRDPDDISVLSLLLSLVACWIINAIAIIALYKVGHRLYRCSCRSET
jgi:hypothetical protein